MLPEVLQEAAGSNPGPMEVEVEELPEVTPDQWKWKWKRPDN